jgi:hypothetical protein
MSAIDHLVVGTFYWVLPELDPDATWRDQWQPGQEWQDDLQPARFAGLNADGELLWNLLGVDGCSNSPVLWVGEAITAPQNALGTSLLERFRRKPA